MTDIAVRLTPPPAPFTDDPFKQGPEHAMVYESDAIVAFGDGIITHFGPVDVIKPQLLPGIPIRDYGRDALISGDFIDSHVHFPQTPMIGAFGAQLLDWLNTYTLPTERKFRFADQEFARSCVSRYLPARLECQMSSPEERQ
jgi:guanine deaminase